MSCGNEYLHAYAVQFNKNCFVIPTTIDTSNLHVPTNQEHDTTSVGWTGSHSTLKYLEALVPVLQSLEKKYPQVEFIIIADRNPRLPVERARFIPWRKDTEISDLARIDIGIMPLPDDPWANGKCGFKALQYLAMGIPAVVSPVGVNKQIVEPGVQGYWSSSLEEWFDKIEQLILNHEQRKQMGRQGRLKVLAQYSTESQADKFLSLFQ